MSKAGRRICLAAVCTLLLLTACGEQRQGRLAQLAESEGSEQTGVAARPDLVLQEPNGENKVSQDFDPAAIPAAESQPALHSMQGEDRQAWLEGDILYIQEKMFVTQVNDIYINPEEYLGKTLRFQGIFGSYLDPDTQQVYYSVIRYGPGCCGIDGYVGFEVLWSEEDKAYAQENDWVEVWGVLEEYEEKGAIFMRIRLEGLEILEERGLEYVDQ